jgi:outer membrane immunogenic protein
MGDETMKFKLFGTGVAALLLLATSLSAQGADIVIPRPVYKGGVQSVVAYYNWTGFYVGINAGYGFGDSTWSLVSAASISPTGFLVGGTAGYNYQVGSIVYGIEGDWDWANVKGSATCAVVATCTTESTWLATFRGRIGYAFDRWLPYFTAGGAYGNVKATASIPILGLSVSSSSSQLGWAIGAGLEYAFLSNWSAKIEYLYVDLGSFNTGPSPLVNNVTFKESIVRAGLNYKFAGPIFSRY